MRLSRLPKIADMIIETCPDTGTRHVGLVREIQLDGWGHQKNVLISWTGAPPRLYQEKYGYAGVNSTMSGTDMRLFEMGGPFDEGG